MAKSPLDSPLGLWNKLQGALTSIASSSFQLVVPELVQLDDMVYEVYRPPHEEKPELEIVFFHGLQLKACREAHITTWMSHDNSEFWPQAWLVEAFPKARILRVCYDSFAKKTNEEGRLDMFLTRENLLSALTSDSTRVGDAQCPVVLVGHCLGGLLLKELCLHANMTLSEKRDDIPGMQRIHNFFNNLRGMFFYGTPHLGSFLGEKLPDCFNGELLAEIGILNAWSARKNASFSDLKSRRKWVTYGMGETQETFLDVLGKYLHVVPEASSRANVDMYYSVDANHSDICKPKGKQSSAFSFLLQFLNEIHANNILRSGDEADAVSRRGYVVDLQGRTRKVLHMLAEPNANTIFIVGLSGIGKTTLAQQVFHDISHTFAITCFIHLDNFQASSRSSEEVLRKIEISLKRQGQGSHCDYFNVPRYLKGQKVLIVLDNVQSQFQLDALSRQIWLEGSNSRLLVTTTESRLGSPSNTFTVKYLTEDESTALFHHCAFADRARPRELRASIQQVIRRCGNFPLSLKILGTYLSVEKAVDDPNLWSDLLVKLENAEEVANGPDYELWARLRPCYYALAPSEQELFLDVAVVFSGFPLNLVECVWSACRRCPTVGWTNLKRAFLVSGDVGGTIWMHELLKNLGRSIACPQNSRVDRWRRIASGSFERNFIARYQGVMESLSLELQVHDNERLILRNTTLAKYVQLEYLILDGTEMSGGSIELPRSLVYLKWEGGSFESCPVDFSGLENLVVLDLQHCKAMKLLPSNVVIAKKLKWLELQGCQSVAKLPEGLYEFADLEYLGLSMTGVKTMSSKIGQLKKLKWFQADQTRLARVPRSVGRLLMLQSLDVSYTAVGVLPESIGDLKGLRTLNARNTSLRALPESIGDLELLRTLDASNTLLSSLPDSIGCLRNLEVLRLDHTGMLTLPESLGNVAQLTYLRLGSSPLETLPDSICLLRRLEDLYLEDTRVSALPDAFGELESLETLSLQGSRVRSLPETFKKLSSLASFDLTVSTILNDGTHSSGSGAHSTISRSRQDLGNSMRVMICFDEVQGGGANCGVKEEGEIPAMIPAFFPPTLPLQRVQSVRIVGNQFSQSLPPTLFDTLKQMASLTSLSLEMLNEVEALPELGALTGLKLLSIASCQRLRELPDSLGLLKRLGILHLINLPRLRRLPWVVDSPGPRIWLTVVNCGSLQSIPRWFGHKSPLDRGLGNECGNSDSNPTVDFHDLESSPIETDSWRLLRCCLECCTGRSLEIEFKVKCEEMETVMKRAVECERELGVQWKVATTVLRKLCLECQVGEDGLHGSFSPTTIWPPLNHWSKVKITLLCNTKSSVSSRCLKVVPCKIHNEMWVRVVDMDEEDSEGKEEESDKGDSDEDTTDTDTEDSEDNPGNIEEAAEIEDQDSETSEHSKNGGCIYQCPFFIGYLFMLVWAKLAEQWTLVCYS